MKDAKGHGSDPRGTAAHQEGINRLFDRRVAQQKVRIKKTPNGRHLYTATMLAVGTYGFGNTPDEARASLARQLKAG
jgi:hypothetical protein